jgi:SAM-dependent methyltransferase
LEKISADWNKENLLWDYERILKAVFNKAQNYKMPKMGIVRTIQSHWRKIFSLPDKSFTWLRNTDAVTDDNLLPITSATYTPVTLPTGAVFNRILDDTARVLYEPTIQKLFEFVPKTMAKKIARANVQQAFIFDTVYRYLSNYPQPKLLCVGSYEDTASIGLQKMGYTVDEIDPMINYFLQEFYTKPTVKKESYDIVFSTSVIEHDPNDQTFMECIEGLLKPGGIAVITCDYKDGWKSGQPKPIEDARFYTKTDLTTRLLGYVPKCDLVDDPQWDCANPDFNYLGKYQYTFASFVIRKKTV